MKSENDFSLAMQWLASPLTWAKKHEYSKTKSNYCDKSDAYELWQGWKKYVYSFRKKQWAFVNLQFKFLLWESDSTLLAKKW